MAIRVYMTAIGMIFNSIQSDSFVLVLVSQKICCLSGSTVSRFLAHLDRRSSRIKCDRLLFSIAYAWGE